MLLPCTSRLSSKNCNGITLSVDTWAGACFLPKSLSMVSAYVPDTRYVDEIRMVLFPLFFKKKIKNRNISSWLVRFVACWEELEFLERGCGRRCV